MPPFRRLLTEIALSLAHLSARVSSGWVAVAAGLCPEDEIRRRTQVYWDADDEDPRQSEAQALSGFMDWELPLVAHLPASGAIGVVGCGSGRDMIAFLRAGFTVDGIDVAPKPVERARAYLSRAGFPASVACADITDAVFPRPAYDAFWFSWFTYSYMIGAHRRVAVLRRLRSQLRPGGVIVLTFLPSTGEGRRFAGLAHWVGRLSGNPHPPEPGDGYTARLSYEHRFTEPQILAEAAEAGFQAAELSIQEIGVAVLNAASPNGPFDAEALDASLSPGPDGHA